MEVKADTASASYAVTAPQRPSTIVDHVSGRMPSLEPEGPFARVDGPEERVEQEASRHGGSDHARRETPRVLHAPVEVSGQAAMAAHGLREIGVTAHAFSRPHSFGYEVGPDLVPGPGRASWARLALRAMRDHDVLHLYFGQTFLPEAARGLDARIARRFGKRVVMEFLGSDIRMPSIEATRNPWYVRFGGEDDDRARARMMRWSAITGGHVIVCDRALTRFVRPYFDHVHVVPFRVDVRRFTAQPPRIHDGAPVVVHAPSHLAGKGTAHVRAAVDALRRRGVSFEYVEISGASQEEALAACARADLVIDQLCVGSHGVWAVEAMCMAKPVICYIHPEVRQLYPEDFPIVDATPATLTDVLAEWLQDPQRRRERGISSRAYAERVHDARTVARLLLQVYEQLP